MRELASFALLAILHLTRCSCNSQFAPMRRFHPTTTFNSNNNQNDLQTAEDVQYAYDGGESSISVGDSNGHIGEVDLTQGHGISVDVSNSHSNNVDLTHAGITSGGSFQTGPDLSHAASDQSPDISHDHSYATYDHDHHISYDHDHEHDFPHPHDHEFTGYAYDHPQGYEYPPPPGHHVIDSLPALTTAAPPPPLPPPPAQAAKQSPNYTYYYLGRHLWYIPLYFSIYFVIYVGALVLKSVARHKILFPENLKVAAQSRALRRLQQGTDKYYM